MDKKGQIFSLDFLLSIILVVLALGLILNFMELHEYNMKEEELRIGLNAVGETAADLLVSGPDIVCELVDTYNESTGKYYNINNPNVKRIGYLANCIPKINAVAFRITKEDLAIPGGYKCKIDNAAIRAGELQTGCGDALQPDVDNIYSAKRIIVLYSGTGSPADKKKIAKKDLEECMKSGEGAGCPLKQSEITLWVWKE